MNELKTSVIPSVVGVGSTDTGMLDIKKKVSKKGRPLRVQWRDDNGSYDYLVGENVDVYARPIERMDYTRFTDGNEVKALTFASLSSVIPTGVFDEELRVVVGLPVAIMADAEQAKANLRGIRSWMKMRHVFSVDGESYDVTIGKTYSVAQPVGSFFAWGLDDSGKWIKSEADSTIAICDIGFNTVDLYTLKDMEVMPRYTAGESLGVRRATEILLDKIEKEYGVTYSLHEVDNMLRMSKPMIHIGVGDKDIKDLVQNSLSAATSNITSFVERRWGNGKNFRVMIFTGGGSVLLKNYLENQYPSGFYFSGDIAATANAIGMARYAKSAAGPSVPVVGLDPGYGGFKIAFIDKKREDGR